MQCNFNCAIPSPVKMFLSSRQAGYSNRQWRQPRPEYKSDKCEVSSRYFVVGSQMAGCWHILTGLNTLGDKFSLYSILDYIKCQSMICALF